MSIFQLSTANILKKIVVNASTSLKTSGSERNLNLTLLVENIIFSIGKAMKISSEKAHLTNLNTVTANMVCTSKFLTYSLSPTPTPTWPAKFFKVYNKYHKIASWYFNFVNIEYLLKSSRNIKSIFLRICRMKKVN